MRDHTLRVTRLQNEWHTRSVSLAKCQQKNYRFLQARKRNYIMKNTRRTVMLFLAVSVAAEVIRPVHAEDSTFYFCSTKVDDHKKYYVTKLFPGKVQIGRHLEFGTYLIDIFNVDIRSLSVACQSYNSDSSTGRAAAEKFRNSEIRKNSINAEVELVDWIPDD